MIVTLGEHSKISIEDLTYLIKLSNELSVTEFKHHSIHLKSLCHNCNKPEGK